MLVTPQILPLTLHVNRHQIYCLSWEQFCLSSWKFAAMFYHVNLQVMISLPYAWIASPDGASPGQLQLSGFMCSLWQFRTFSKKHGQSLFPCIMKFIYQVLVFRVQKEGYSERYEMLKRLIIIISKKDKSSVWWPDHTVDKCLWCKPTAGESAKEAPDPMSGSETLQKVWNWPLSCESNTEKSQHEMRCKHCYLIKHLYEKFV